MLIKHFRTSRMKYLAALLVLVSPSFALAEPLVVGLWPGAPPGPPAKVTGPEINQTKPEKLHLFLAVPFGLAVFLGHQWNALNKKVQCYEWIGGDTIYAPAGELQF